MKLFPVTSLKFRFIWAPEPKTVCFTRLSASCGTKISETGIKQISDWYELVEVIKSTTSVRVLLKLLTQQNDRKRKKRRTLPCGNREVRREVGSLIPAGL